MVDTSWLGVGMGASLTLIPVAMRYVQVTGWAAGADITDAVLETRAASRGATSQSEYLDFLTFEKITGVFHCLSVGK
jgi:hypothetical protein